MVPLTPLGSGAPAAARVERYPFSVGRARTCDWALDAPGVWPDHFRLEHQPGEGLRLISGSEAITLVNGQRVRSARLRNGDVIGAGGLRLAFMLAPAAQRDFTLREALTWAAVGLLALAQVLLMAWWVA
jgi:predicted component of type VI protein secretion system